MTYLATNNGKSTLAVGLGGTVGDTTLQIQVGDVSKFPVVNNGGTGSDFTMLTLRDAAHNMEIVKVTRHDSGSSSFTVQRAQEGTSVRSWQIGDSVSCRLTAGIVQTTYTHPSQSVAAHAASAISFTPTGNIASTDVQAALAELDSEKVSAGHTHSATAITFTPTGNILSTNVSAALAELDSDLTAAINLLAAYLPLAGGTMTGVLNMTAVAINTALTTVASAASPNIWSGGNVIDYTGTVTATGFSNAPQAGASRKLICAAAAPFTAGANMLIDGVASGTTYTCAAGDEVEVTAVSTTQFRLRIKRANGAAVIQYYGGVRQTVQAAPVDTSGLPNFLPATSSGTTLTSTGVSSTVPIVVNAAGGGGSSGLADRVGVSTSNLSWTGLTVTNTVKNYLYVDVAANGTLTTGVTTVAPVYQPGGTPAVTSGLFTFNYGEMRGYLGNGSTAPQGYRVYVGEGTGNGTNVASIVAYALNGIYDSGYTATLPGNASLTSKNHNLGTPNGIARMWFKCGTAELGLAVGDEFYNVAANETNVMPFQYVLSRLSVSVRASANALPWRILNQTTGSGANLTLANHSYKFIVMRGW